MQLLVNKSNDFFKKQNKKKTLTGPKLLNGSVKIQLTNFIIELIYVSLINNTFTSFFNSASLNSN